MSAEPMSPERLAEIRSALELAMEVLPPKGRPRYLTASWFWTCGMELLAEVDRLRSDPVRQAAIEWGIAKREATLTAPSAMTWEEAEEAGVRATKAADRLLAALSGEHPERNDG